MTIHETLKKELPEAMRARDEVRLRTLRALLTAFTNEVISMKDKPDGVLPDEKAIEVLRRAEKQRRDSIDQFERGGRPDLARHEQEELAIIEKYLPEMMDKEEIEKVVKSKIEELHLDKDPSKAGMLMGEVMKTLKGKANGNDVKEIIDEQLGK